MTPTLTYLALTLVGMDLGDERLPMAARDSSFKQPRDAPGIASRRSLGNRCAESGSRLRPTQFRVATGNEPLPHVVSDAGPVCTRDGPADRARQSGDPSRGYFANSVVGDVTYTVAFVDCPAEVDRLAAHESAVERRGESVKFGGFEVPWSCAGRQFRPDRSAVAFDVCSLSPCWRRTSTSGGFSWKQSPSCSHRTSPAASRAPRTTSTAGPPRTDVRMFPSKGEP